MSGGVTSNLTSSIASRTVLLTRRRSAGPRGDPWRAAKHAAGPAAAAGEAAVGRASRATETTTRDRMEADHVMPTDNYLKVIRSGQRRLHEVFFFDSRIPAEAAQALEQASHYADEHASRGYAPPTLSVWRTNPELNARHGRSIPAVGESGGAS